MTGQSEREVAVRWLMGLDRARFRAVLAEIEDGRRRVARLREQASGADTTARRERRRAQRAARRLNRA